MDWELLKSVVVGVFVVTTLVAAGLLGLVYGDQKRSRTTADELRKRVDDLVEERTEIKEKLTELGTRLAERDTKIAERDGEIALLKNVVTGKVEWIALTDQLEEHHRQALAYWKKADERMAAMLHALEDK